MASLLTFDVNVVFRRHTQEEWALEDPVVRPGELVVESNTNRFKIGDGVKKYSELPFAGIGGGDPGAAVPSYENNRIPSMTTASAYTLGLEDTGKMMVFAWDGSSTGTVVTVPFGTTLPIGTILKGINVTERDLAIVGAPGVTVQPAGNVVHGHMGQFQLYKYAANYWFLSGDIGVPST